MSGPLPFLSFPIQYHPAVLYFTVNGIVMNQ